VWGAIASCPTIDAVQSNDAAEEAMKAKRVTTATIVGGLALVTLVSVWILGTGRDRGGAAVELVAMYGGTATSVRAVEPLVGAYPRSDTPDPFAGAGKSAGAPGPGSVPVASRRRPAVATDAAPPAGMPAQRAHGEEGVARRESTAVARTPPPSAITSPPVRIHHVQPDFPRNAQRMGVGGVVVLAVTVKADGTVGEIRVIRDPGYGFADAATAAVRQWRYEPALAAGRPAEMTITVQVAFER
jgi:TonB family protein